MKLLPLLLAAAAGALLSTTADANRVVQDYEINLDLDPRERYAGLFTLPGTDFNATVWTFWNTYFADHAALTDLLYGIAAKRGPENDEQQAEIEGMAEMSGLDVRFVQSIQMLYELQTIMVPIVNFTGSEEGGELSGGFEPVIDLPEEYAALASLPWRGPGCTGIIARCEDGTVYHARNLDFAPLDIMTKLVYNGIFTRGGVEVFRSQMVAGYTMAITGLRSGENGFAIERNTRYADKWGGFYQMMKNLESGRTLNGWTLRKTLETIDNYDDAVAHLSTEPYASTEYAIVSGVQKGTILSRDPDGVAHAQTLDAPEGNFDERDDYIIITNFDFFWGDVREYFDPTGGDGMFHPRRTAAQKVLNATEEGHLTSDVLWEAINNHGTFADTIFQAIINVETGLWNTSQPDV